MVVGIFASWNHTSFFESAEDLFKRRLDHDPVYPFEEIEPQVYRLRVKSFLPWWAGLAIVATVCVAMGMYWASPVDQWIAIHIVIVCWMFYVMGSSLERRTFVLYGKELQYEFYKGDKLVYRGHYHNIYVRLRGQRTGSGDVYFDVTLSGYQVDEEVITSSTTRVEKLRKLGRRLAHRLNINYFDYMDKSTHHIIRHRCPYAEEGKRRESDKA